MSFLEHFSSHGDAYQELTTTPYNASMSQEMITSAVTYEAAMIYDNHITMNGKPDSHAEAKEMFASFVGAITDRTIETWGLDHIDKEKVKYQAQEHAQDALAEEY